MKGYFITEQQMKMLRERLELSNMKQQNVYRLPSVEAVQINDVFRAFNFVVCRWIEEVGSN